MTRLAWQVQPTAFVGVVLLDSLQGLAPLATAWLTKHLFDLFAQGLQQDSNGSLVFYITLVLVAQVLITIFSYMLGVTDSYLRAELGRKLALYVQSSIYKKVNSFIGLKYFEDPQFYDIIALASRGAENGPVHTLRNFSDCLRGIVVLASFISILLWFNPLLALVVIVATLPQLYTQIQIGRQRFKLAVANTFPQRQMSYYGSLLSNEHYVKEVRLFGLADWLLSGFLGIATAYQQSQRQQELREIKWQLPIELLAKLVAGGAFIFIALQVLAGQLSLGDVTLYMSAVSSVQANLAGIIFALAGLNENVLFYRQYMRLMALPSDIPFPESARPLPPLGQGIELRNVSFRYADSRPWVLRHFNLFIPAGHCVALVGLNGAGKTTLVKLLTRLYDVTEGEILWDGIDIRCFEPEALRQQMGVIFQDFARYNLSVRENIGVGGVAHLDDEGRIMRAGRQAGLADVIQKLPRGYDTILSRWLVEEADAGAELSGGQWQKVALARLFMRNATFYILDEPTAALDAQAEHEVFEQFVTLTAGRTSLLISHRFSTVSMADVVAVIEKGQVIEYGSHQALLAAGGSYARLYMLQAARYSQNENTLATAEVRHSP
ncbi:MAG: ABC transporter ATP-binding protein/permease [Anaerolineae bacterium]|nr:ABC transporter ATP-binding protein/permease [Anaerolineae bacterium]